REQRLTNQNLPLLDTRFKGRCGDRRHRRRSLRSTGRRPGGPRLRRLRNVRRLGTSLNKTLNPPAFRYTFGATIKVNQCLRHLNPTAGTKKHGPVLVAKISPPT